MFGQSAEDVEGQGEKISEEREIAVFNSLLLGLDPVFSRLFPKSTILPSSSSSEPISLSSLSLTLLALRQRLAVLHAIKELTAESESIAQETEDVEGGEVRKEKVNKMLRERSVILMEDRVKWNARMELEIEVGDLLLKSRTSHDSDVEDEPRGRPENTKKQMEEENDLNVVKEVAEKIQNLIEEAEKEIEVLEKK